MKGKQDKEQNEQKQDQTSECECEKNTNCECECENCECEDECDCEKECCEKEADEKCECEHKKHHYEQKHEQQQPSENEYLLMAQRLQADFENYRRRVGEQLERVRKEGVKSVIEVFLPCLDTFKEAKKTITDENVLSGVNMIENKILDALKSLKVEKIEAVGTKFDPHKHNVIAISKDESKEDDIVLEEFQAGWTFEGDVLRYSKVIVNKLG